MKAWGLKFCFAVLAGCVLSSAANATVSIYDNVSYDFVSPASSLGTFTSGQTLITDFGSTAVGNTAVFSLASGYGFSWRTDKSLPASVATVFDSSSSNDVTGVYANAGLISGISAPPPGDTPDYFTVVGANGQATLTAAKALTSFSLLWGSMDGYNTISFETAGGAVVQSFTGDLTAVPPGPGAGNGDQGAYSTNRWVRFSIDGVDDVTKVVFTSTSNSFEFDNLYASAVPEPAAWLMMIAGFGLVGAMMRRRSTSALTA